MATCHGVNIKTLSPKHVEQQNVRVSVHHGKTFGVRDLLLGHRISRCPKTNWQCCAMLVHFSHSVEICKKSSRKSVCVFQKMVGICGVGSQRCTMLVFQHLTSLEVLVFLATLVYRKKMDQKLALALNVAPWLGTTLGVLIPADWWKVQTTCGWKLQHASSYETPEAKQVS